MEKIQEMETEKETDSARVKTRKSKKNMGGGVSSIPPRMSDFAAGTDMARVHDVPWMTTLREIGDVDENAVEEQRAKASREDLHSMRFLQRVFAAWTKAKKREEEEEEEEEEVLRRVFFVAMQSPGVAVVFYCMMRQCAALRIVTLEPLPEFAQEFVALALVSLPAAVVATAQAEEKEENIDCAGVREAMRGVLVTFFDECFDLLYNPQFQSPQIEVLEKEDAKIFTLQPMDGSIEARVCSLGGTMVSLRTMHRETGEIAQHVLFDTVASLVESKEKMRAAENPENSSGCRQVFYGELRRLEFWVEDGGVLLVRQTVDARQELIDASELMVFEMRWMDSEEHFAGRSASRVLEQLGRLESASVTVWAANAKVEKRGALMTIGGTTNWLVKLVFQV